jgi:photosystem II stability/assembly factor-like uncharacterized protein
MISFRSNLLFIRNLLFVGLLIFLLSCDEDEVKQEKIRFNWENVLIGGGGYVTGLTIHPENGDLWYIRTDVGSSYRWNNSDYKLTPITDWISIDNANLYGINGMALDPDNDSILFAALGRYSFSKPSDVLVSGDRGRTWAFTNLNMPFGANEMPEKLGNKLAINPHDYNYLWCGTVGKGLWIYNRAEKSWQRNTGLDTLSNIQSLAFHPEIDSVCFIATVDGLVYRSNNGGEDFSVIKKVEGEISDLSVSSQGDYLYCSTMKDGVYVLHEPAISAEWREISPLKNAEYRCITADPFLEEGVALIPRMMDGLREGFYYSSNAGRNWTLKPAKIEQYIPWHDRNYPGAAASSIVFHPNDEGVVFVTDWYSVYKTENFREDSLLWTNESGVGHEELVCLNLAAPPPNEEGIILYSAHADVGGFAHHNEDEYPEIVFRDGDNKTLKNTTGLAFSEKNPGQLYRIGAIDHKGDRSFFASSNDYGRSWKIHPSYDSAWKWGRVAASASDPEKVVVATVEGGIRYSHNGGKTFSLADFPGVTGLSGPVFRYGYSLTSDKENGRKFYYYNRKDGEFYRSEDFGKSWSLIHANLPVPRRKYYEYQLDSDYYSLISVPGHEGHLLLSLADKGLFFSQNGGESWVKMENISEAPLVAAGKAFPLEDYPAIYTLAKMEDDSELWYYMSTDKGENWHRINDRSERTGNNPEIMAADRHIHGRVYVGTNGSGVVTGFIVD